MKMKEFGPPGASLAPSLDPPLKFAATSGRVTPNLTCLDENQPVNFSQYYFWLKKEYALKIIL